ncbi:MAG: ATP synthase subunit I [Clostridia bacterium]|nr:ATP synthase subunit I [Clostridia bacterium]
MKVDETVKKETLYIAAWCAVLSVLMQAVFLVIGYWDYTVLLGNLWGYSGAVANFFLMGLTVQKAVTKTEEEARKTIKLSQTLRNMFILIIAVVGITVPFFNMWAAIIPLLFPRIAILFRSFSLKK